MSAVAEEGNLAQQVAMTEDPEESLFPIDSAPHLDRALVHQIDLSAGGITLAEDHLARPERPDTYILDLAIHGCSLPRDDTAVAARRPRARRGGSRASQNRWRCVA